MNAFSDFLRSRWGLVTLAAALVLIVIFAWPGSKAARRPPAFPLSAASNVVTQTTRNVGSIPPPPTPPAAPKLTVVTNAPKRPVVLVIDAKLPPTTNARPTLFAPAGTLFKCVLVNSVESIRIDTRIVGLVTEDVWFQDKLVVPKGTRVLGQAQVDRVRDRLAANGRWKLVFPTGEELLVQGNALHADVSPDGTRYGPENGTAGLKGKVIHSASWDELKLFAATFLSGMSRGLQRTEYTIYGSQVPQTLQNGALNGSAAVIDEYARSIAESIKRDGVYVRVEHDTPFYLFLPNMLDRSLAQVGATRLAN